MMMVTFIIFVFATILIATPATAPPPSPPVGAVGHPTRRVRRSSWRQAEVARGRPTGSMDDVLLDFLTSRLVGPLNRLTTNLTLDGELHLPDDDYYTNRKITSVHVNDVVPRVWRSFYRDLAFQLVSNLFEFAELKVDEWSQYSQICWYGPSKSLQEHRSGGDELSLATIHLTLNVHNASLHESGVYIGIFYYDDPDKVVEGQNMIVHLPLQLRWTADEGRDEAVCDSGAVVATVVDNSTFKINDPGSRHSSPHLTINAAAISGELKVDDIAILYNNVQSDADAIASFIVNELMNAFHHVVVDGIGITAC